MRFKLTFLNRIESITHFQNRFEVDKDMAEFIFFHNHLFLFRNRYDEQLTTLR